MSTRTESSRSTTAYCCTTTRANSAASNGAPEFRSASLDSVPSRSKSTSKIFATRLRRKAAVKPLLLNQAFLAGLGNIYVDESLFAAGIHPLATASRLSRAAREEVARGDPRHSDACD